MTPNELTPDLAAFIEAQTSIFLATASANGQPHIQHRGPPRFLRVLDRVLDDKTPGNGDRSSQIRHTFNSSLSHVVGGRNAVPAMTEV